MAIERAFLDDIIAHPEDDAPRLIFADWLGEHGDEARAEFIRVQVALAKKRLPPGSGPRRDPRTSRSCSGHRTPARRPSSSMSPREKRSG